MLHEYISLDAPMRNFANIAERLARARGPSRLLGLWAAEIGPLNRVIMMRAYDDDAAFLADRRALTAAEDPLGVGELITGYTADAYVPFDWIAPVPAGDHGPWFEIRTYGLRLGALPKLDAAWRHKLPIRAGFSDCLAAGTSLDGAPRFPHLWPYRSLDARDRIRAEAAATGMWPPNVFPGSLPPPMQTMICKALPGSPLY